MKKISTSIAIIGAGSAGLSAYRAAAAHDKKVLLIEGGVYGTTCARVGCMPSKLLIAAADAAHAVQKASKFGVHSSIADINGREVMARVRSERDRFVGFVLDDVERLPASDKLRGQASFISPNQLQVDDHTVVSAEQIIIATGSTPQVPPFLTELGSRLVTSDQMFDWEDLPDSVAVIGTGVIGLELGQALHRLGVGVTFFGRSAQLAGITDPSILAQTQTVLGAELDLRLNVEITSAASDARGVLLTWKDATGAIYNECFSNVLAASGRKPALTNLNLANSALALDDDGVPTFDAHTMLCGSSTIFIAGDASNERTLLHEAADQGRIAGHNAASYPDVHEQLRRAQLAIAFTDPQIAMVGGGYLAAQLKHHAVGEVSFTNQGRSRVMLQNYGMLHVYGEHGTGLFLGAEICGPSAEHLAHLMAWALQMKLTVSAMLEMPFYHPVIEEGLRTALQRLQEKIRSAL